MPSLDTDSGPSCITFVHHFGPITGDPVAADLDVLKDLTRLEDMLAFGRILNVLRICNSLVDCWAWTWPSASRRCAA